jgi:putative PEP-CTERM system histidine kinase
VNVLQLLEQSGYLLSSISYFIFLLLLLAARNKTFLGQLVLLATVSFLVEFWLAALQRQQGFSLSWVLLADQIRLACWMLLVLATKSGLSTALAFFRSRLALKYIALLTASITIVWLLSTQFLQDPKYLFMQNLMMNLWLLVLIEQLYRNADVKAKQAIWPLSIGLGAIAVFDFIMFAQAVLLNQLDFSYWLTRPYIAIIGVPFLLISTRRMKDWSVRVFVSRDVVFYSSMLMITGLYLLIMALAGYVINFYGGNWGPSLSLAFLVLGCIVLVVLLMTERLRKELKVFITKHFFANKYDYRVEWLKLIDQLQSQHTNDYYQSALNIIRNSLAIDVGAIVKKHPSTAYQVLYADGVIIDQALLAEMATIEPFCLQHQWLIDIREYNKLENSYPELLFDSDVFTQAGISLIVPIWAEDGIYGFFLLSSPHNDSRLLNWEDRDLLAAIAKQLSHYLALNEAKEKLAEAKQFDAFHRMSAFLVHDLKNVQAQLSLINSNAERHRNNPEFIDDVFETVASATQRLEKMLTQLRNKSVIENERARVNIAQLLEKVVKQRNLQQPHINLSCANDIAVVIEPETFSSVINHLLQNAQEATNESGWVNISVDYIDQALHISISDNGCGMSETFIKERLFKPFDTTKGNAGMGIGVFEAKQFVENLGGSIQVTSAEGKGTTFVLTIPCQS